VDWSVVAYVKTNGQVERAYGMLLQGLKPRIFKCLKKFRLRWVAELPSNLWSLHIMPNRATSFTLFFMVHGSEAVLSTDIHCDSPKLQAYTEERNQVAIEDAIYQLDEVHDVALLHSSQYQQSLRCYHECNVRRCEFQVGDLVLR
jgi:hypothetical protein